MAIRLINQAAVAELVQRFPREADGVVLTLSLRSRVEETADARVENSEASYPSLTGFQAVKLPDVVPHWNAAPKASEQISPADASMLAALAQRTAEWEYEGRKVPPGANPLSEHFMPYELRGMSGSAFRIGREIWRLKTRGKKPINLQDRAKLRPGDWATSEEEATASKIFEWNKSNLETVIPKGRR